MEDKSENEKKETSENDSNLTNISTSVPEKSKDVNFMFLSRNLKQQRQFKTIYSNHFITEKVIKLNRNTNFGILNQFQRLQQRK